MPGGIHPPLEVLLAWPAPNYVNPIEKPKLITAIACIFGPLTISLLFARLWVRMHMQRSASWDDWLMIAASVPLIAITVLIPLSADKFHFNKHVWDVQPRFFVVQRKFVLAIETTFCVASGLIKVSILLFYRRLSSRSISATFRWATWFTIAFIVLYSIAFALVPIFGCSPISAFWEQVDLANVFNNEYKYRCFNEGADVFAAAVISTAQDFLTAILPTFIYWNLQMPFRQKIALFGIFAIGYGVAAAGILRSYFTWQTFFESYDVTWIVWNAWLWSLIELHVGAMCANAPALKVFFKEYFKLEKITPRPKSRSAGPRARGSSSFPTRSSGSKFSFWKSSHSTDGYLSEPHTQISVDQHGGVQVQKDIHITRDPISPYSSADIGSGRYNDDIEMGSFQPLGQRSNTGSATDEELRASPQIPDRSKARAPGNDTPQQPAPAEAKKSLSPFPLNIEGKEASWQN